MKRRLVVGVAAAVACAVPGAAAAAYLSAPVRTQTVSSAAFVPPVAPKTATPTASPSSAGVSLSWDASLMSDGRPVTGYAVFRYVDSSPRSGRTLLSGCTVTVSTRVSCTDTTAVAGTTYVYATAPQYRNWRGPESGASSPVTISSPLTVTGLALRNGNGTPGSGRIEKGDSLVITWSRAIKPSTLSAYFRDDATGAQTEQGFGQVTVNILNQSSTDVLTLTGKDQSIAFGRVDLGSTAWVTSDVTFGGNGENVTRMTLSADRTQLTVTLGKPDPANAAPTVTSAVTATYRPDDAVKSSDGSTSVSGTQSTTGTAF